MGSLLKEENILAGTEHRSGCISAKAQLGVRHRWLFALTASLLAHLGVVALIEGSMATARRHHTVIPSSRATTPAALQVLLSRQEGLHPSGTKSQTTEQPLPHEGPQAPDADTDMGAAEHLGPLPLIPSLSSYLPASTYFGADELSRKAQVTRDIRQDNPVLAKSAENGKAILVLFINETGRIDRVEIESSEVSETLIREVAHEFNAALFQPAQIDGNAVKSRMRIEVLIRSTPQP